MHSIEQLVREVLEAVREDQSLFEMFRDGWDPQTFSAGDIVVPANRLNKLLHENDLERAAGK